MIKLSREWRLPDGVPVIVMPGRITRWKGHEILIEALTKLGDQPTHCIMVGSYEGKASYKAELEGKIAKAGLSASVMFAGSVADMPCVYQLADVVVSASIDPEPFGRVMIEAQAMGRPIVATDHGGARESVLSGETGFLVKPNDADALAEGIRKALALTTEQRAVVTRTAVAHIHKHYTTRDMCARTLSVYEEVLPRRSMKIVPQIRPAPGRNGCAFSSSNSVRSGILCMRLDRCRQFADIIRRPRLPC